MTRTSKKVSGSCLCGAVDFSVTLPSKWCAHCHCNMCRKEHGAGYVTWVGFEQDQVGFNADNTQLRWYQSSPGAARGFCKKCGSSMFFRSQRWANEIHVALGCLNGKIDRHPQANVFLEQHVSWMPVDETLARVDL